MSKSPWLLPQGVTEILPDAATKLEALRRHVIDDLQESGFKLVIPPMMEFIDSLIQGAGVDLTTQTFKVPDQDSLKTLGIRADMTPQIAQIDAHRLQSHAINRLCYVGTVLRTKPSSLGGSRELLQMGAEIFGDDSLTADQSIVDAMVSSLKLGGIDSMIVSLSHVGIFSDLVTQLALDETLVDKLFNAMQRKSTPDIAELNAASESDLTIFQELLSSRGDRAVIPEFAQTLKNAGLLSEKIETALSNIDDLAKHLEKNSAVDVHVDLVELHGYRYHTGLTFQAFIDNEGKAIAKGGRYAGISHDDTIRPATGFSADLKVLANVSS